MIAADEARARLGALAAMLAGLPERQRGPSPLAPLILDELRELERARARGTA